MSDDEPAGPDWDVCGPPSTGVDVDRGLASQGLAAVLRIAGETTRARANDIAEAGEGIARNP